MTILQERYELLKLLAEGGENIVYFSKDLHTQEQVVLKRTKNGIPAEDQGSWKRATVLLQQLEISTVAKVYDAFVDVEKMVSYGYVVQQYIDGETLASEFARKRYTQSEILTAVKEIMAIVCQLQEFSPPILHRDIKPANIIRHSRDGKLILLDFGLATEHQNKDFGHTMGVGTLGYQAPEQLSGFPTLNTDVYSVGVIALQLLTRREPRDLLWGNTLKWESSAQFLHKDWRDWLTKSLAPAESRFEDAQDALMSLQKSHFGQKVRQSTTPIPVPKKSPPPAISIESQKRAPQSQPQPQPAIVPNTSSPPVRRSRRQKHPDLQKTKQYFVLSILAFFLVGFFAVPFIWHFNKKRKELESQL